MRKSSRLAASIGFLCALTAAAPAAAAPDSAWTAVDGIFGQAGKDQPGGVHRFSWPRTDLVVRIGDVTIEPPLALGSWAAFHGMANGSEVMGDLVLLGPEVSPVVRALVAGGFEILAVHNHLIEESPRVMYVHYHGKGEAAEIARTLKTALSKSATPMTSPPGAAAPLSADQQTLFASVERAVGRKGAMAGRVLQFAIPRAEQIRDAGMDVPQSMGMAEAVNFQAAAGGVATTGDFVLLADEVDPVIRALHAAGIDVTALHSHMLRETPRLFFLHFWGTGSPEKIGGGIRAALAKIATKAPAEGNAPPK